MKIITYLILNIDYKAITKIYNSLMVNTIKSCYNKYKSSNPIYILKFLYIVYINIYMDG